MRTTAIRQICTDPNLNKTSDSYNEPNIVLDHLNYTFPEQRTRELVMDYNLAPSEMIKAESNCDVNEQVLGINKIFPNLTDHEQIYDPNAIDEYLSSFPKYLKFPDHCSATCAMINNYYYQRLIEYFEECEEIDIFEFDKLINHCYPCCPNFIFQRSDSPVSADKIILLTDIEATIGSEPPPDIFEPMKTQY